MSASTNGASSSAVAQISLTVASAETARMMTHTGPIAFVAVSIAFSSAERCAGEHAASTASTTR